MSSIIPRNYPRTTKSPKPKPKPKRASGRQPRGWAKFVERVLLLDTVVLSKRDRDALRRSWRLLPETVRIALARALRGETRLPKRIDVVKEIRRVLPAAVQSAKDAVRTAKWRKLLAVNLPRETLEALEALEHLGDDNAWRLALQIVADARGMSVTLADFERRKEQR